eukprot:45285-Amorphochlora_amoeboformis.AAC.1
MRGRSLTAIACRSTIIPISEIVEDRWRQKYSLEMYSPSANRYYPALPGGNVDSDYCCIIV